MWQAGTAARVFAREFKWHAWDEGMVEEDAKVHLVLALNQDTLAHLDAYITMRGGDGMARLETVQDRLRRIPYI